MAWSGGNFTRANPTWVTDASLGIGIEAGRHDAQDNDFTTGIDQCLNKTGQNSMTGDLNLGGYKAVNAAAGTAAAPAICAGNDVNTGMYSSAADEVSFATNGVVRTTIDSVGNVGLGTGGDATPEGVAGASAKQLTVKATASYAQINMFSRTSTSDGSAINLSKSRGDAVNNFTIVTAGDTVGSISFRGATGTQFSPCATIAGVSDSTPSSTSMPGRLVFSTTPSGALASTERMRIDSSGNVGIGTNSSTHRLIVRGSDSTSGNFAIRTENSAAAITFSVRNDGYFVTGAGANSPYNLTTATAANCNIDTDGALRRSTSSLRYKTDVQNYTRGLDDVNALRPVFYKGKNDGSVQFAGLIAEEVHAAGLTEFVAYNSENEPDSLYYGNMVALAFKAIQELNAKVEALEAKVENLEAVTAGL
jgi:hypothetical protein